MPFKKSKKVRKVFPVRVTTMDAELEFDLPVSYFFFHINAFLSLIWMKDNISFMK